MKSEIPYRQILPWISILAIATGCLIFWLILDKSHFPEKEFEEEEKEGYDKPEGFANFYHQITTSIGQKKNRYKTNYAFYEFQKAIKNNRNRKSSKSTFVWEQRGPGNVGGRTREVILDPDDATNQTWYAAAVSGGIWKTTNGGQTWQNLTEDLPNLATNTIVMAPSDHDVIYTGTGEGYGGYGMVNGAGIFKSTNRGEDWTQLESTIHGDNFRWVNKIVVDEDDADEVVVATNAGIFKSTNGGITWDTVYFYGYSVQDIAVNPKDPRTLYAAVNSLGIIKSYDHGSSWFNSFQGISTGYRFSVTVSPVDTNYVYASAEAPKTMTDIYISLDGASNWRRLNDYDHTFIHFLGPQGWFNNVIKADPFNKYKVFVGGVYLGSVTFRNTTRISDPMVIRVDTSGTGSFMEFVNFGGDYLRGGMTTGLDEDADVEEQDFVSVEIRFGPGISQQAHRFTVPAGEGPGVPPKDYTYQNYCSVPFQAWDINNNRQLMVSFRDQENDGKFNLIEREFNDDIGGREYIFVHSISYSGTPDPEIAVNGGHFHKMLYFIWPTLPEDKQWNPDDLPESCISIQYGTITLQDASTTVLSDENRNSNLHVDHHDLKFAVTNEENQDYFILEANDGGLGISYDKGLSWEQIRNGYITTQFYGVAKKPGVYEFVGGMQDNGTWQSPSGISAGTFSEYEERVGGDGFEALWHPLYPHRILASSYYNAIRLSTDGGETWSAVTDGMTRNGPFITRLSNSPSNPDLVFAVGDKGVYRHTNFCVGRYPWDIVKIDSGWTVFGEVTSSHNVEVSLADPSIIWAGAGMYENPDLNVFVSVDYGESFERVNNYSGAELGYLTAIATHPVDSATAYLLFSLDHKPKILRTADLGETWEDISGFGTDSSSNNGFPDVMVFSLLVFPYNTDILWAGTEIGIFESTDNGATWHYADNGLPAVSVWQMFIQDQTIVVATHGRGIWTASQWPGGIDDNELDTEFKLLTFPNPSNGQITLRYESEIFAPLRISVYTLSGKKMLSVADKKTEYRFQKQFDLTTLPEGTYIVTVSIADKTFSSRVIIGN
jgi:photosystem II stability/assembly factor-like uncharacterized protein